MGFVKSDKVWPIFGSGVVKGAELADFLIKTSAPHPIQLANEASTKTQG